jgi:hypothetical protein
MENGPFTDEILYEHLHLSWIFHSYVKWPDGTLWNMDKDVNFQKWSGSAAMIWSFSKLINIDQTSSKKNGFGSFGRERAVLVFGFQCLEQIIQKPDPRKTVREGSILVRLKYGDTNEDMMSNHKIQGYPVDPICSRKPFLVVFFFTLFF